MNSKTVDQRFKIYNLCYSNDYIIDFKFSSITKKVTKLEQYSEFSQNESIILNLVESFLTCFSRSRSFYILYLNNFFITYKLYQRLYELGIEVNDTAKIESNILKELTYLRDVMTKQIIMKSDLIMSLTT